MWVFLFYSNKTNIQGLLFPTLTHNVTFSVCTSVWIKCRRAIWDGNPTRVFQKTLTETTVFEKMRATSPAPGGQNAPFSSQFCRKTPWEGRGVQKPWQEALPMKAKGQILIFSFRWGESSKLLLLDADWFKKNYFSSCDWFFFSLADIPHWGWGSVLDTGRWERSEGATREERRTDFHQGGFSGQ